ncbi:MAG: hypothetical protein ACI8Y4_003066 [Candidatus Poriferisodalaceae bacterium]
MPSCVRPSPSSASPSQPRSCQVSNHANALPFPESEVELAGKPQTIILANMPDAGQVTTIEAHLTNADRLVTIGSAIHWLPEGSILDTSLKMNEMLAAAGSGPTQHTVRTHNTIARIAKKFC